jgi:hypothetical protein
MSRATEPMPMRISGPAPNMSTCWQRTCTGMIGARRIMRTWSGLPTENRSRSDWPCRRRKFGFWKLRTSGPGSWHGATGFSGEAGSTDCVPCSRAAVLWRWKMSPGRTGATGSCNNGSARPRFQLPFRKCHLNRCGNYYNIFSDLELEGECFIRASCWYS